MDVVGELDLRQYLVAGGGHPDRTANDGGLGDGGVEDSRRSKSVGQPLRGLEHASLAAGDVLAEEDGVLVFLEDLMKRAVDRCDQVDRLPLDRRFRLGDGGSGGDYACIHARARLVGVGCRLGLLDGSRQELDDFLIDLPLVRLGEEPVLDEVLLEPAQRVLLPPPLYLIPTAVEGVVVVGSVGVVAVGVRLDQSRALA